MAKTQKPFGSRIWAQKEKIIGTIVGIVLLAVLLTQVSLTEVYATIRHISWDVLVIIFGLTAVVYLIRAMRFQLLFKKEIPLKQLFLIVCAHNLANNVLPARMGELTLIYLSNRASTLKVPYITIALLVARLLDLFWTLVFFVILLVLLQNPSPELIIVRNLALVGALALLIGGIFVYRYQERIVARLTAKTHTAKWKKKIAGILVNGSEVISLLKQQPVLFLKLCGLTMAIWAIAFYSTFVLTDAMGLGLGYFKVAIGTLFVVLTSVLPINSFLSIGVYEGAWTLAMVLLGVEKDLAITSGVAMHMIRILTFFAFGALGLRLFLRLSRKVKAAE